MAIFCGRAALSDCFGTGQPPNKAEFESARKELVNLLGTSSLEQRDQLQVP